MRECSRGRGISYRVFSVDEEDAGEEQGEVVAGGYGVASGAVLLVAECVGTGVLALPRDAWRLGLARFAVILGANYALNISAGALLDLAARGTRARDQAELAAMVAPKLLESMAASAWYSNLFLVLGQYVLVMSKALELVVGAVCTPLSSFAAAGCAMALAQRARTMAHLHGPSIVSIAAICAILVACVAAVPRSGPNRRWIPPHLDGALAYGPLETGAAVSSVVFATGTQKLLLNVRKEMHIPRATPALVLAITSFTLLYLALVCAAGPDPPPFLLDVLESKPWPIARRAAGFLLFAHVLVSYTINLQPLAKTLQRFLCQSDDDASTSARVWFSLTAAITTAAWLVANAVPFFDDLVSLVGALASAPLTFALPALLFAHSPAARTRPRPYQINTLLAVTLVVQVAGTAGSIAAIVRHWEARKGPFHC